MRSKRSFVSSLMIASSPQLECNLIAAFSSSSFTNTLRCKGGLEEHIFSLRTNPGHLNIFYGGLDVQAWVRGDA